MRARISSTMAGLTGARPHPCAHHHFRRRGDLRPLGLGRPGRQFLQHHALHRPLGGRLCGAHHERARHAAECRGAAAADDHHPPGSILEPGWNAAVAAGNHETSMRVVDAVIRAMEGVIPDRLTAGGPATSGLLAFAEPLADGGWRMLYEVHGGGEGARHDRDGCPATRVHLANTSNTPAEMIEANYAIRVERQAIRRGSGGAGRHRGGEGVIRAYRVLARACGSPPASSARSCRPMGSRAASPARPIASR